MRVIDSGPGIKGEDIDKLFINFSKLADTNRLNQQGTGLGLSICKHIIETMGGDVKVESKGLGYGSTFIVNLTTISKVEHQRLTFDNFNNDV